MIKQSWSKGSLVGRHCLRGFCVLVNWTTPRRLKVRDTIIQYTTKQQPWVKEIQEADFRKGSHYTLSPKYSLKTFTSILFAINGPLVRYVKLRVAHAPGMLGTFSPPPRVRDPDVHYGTCVTHVPRCMPGSLTSGFLWSRWRNQQFCVTGKRPIK